MSTKLFRLIDAFEVAIADSVVTLSVREKPLNHSMVTFNFSTIMSRDVMIVLCNMKNVHCVMCFF